MNLRNKWEIRGRIFGYLGNSIMRNYQNYHAANIVFLKLFLTFEICINHFTPKTLSSLYFLKQKSQRK